MKKEKTHEIAVVVSDGGIVHVEGVPEGVILKIFDEDWPETVQAHIYEAGGKETHRDATDEEVKKYELETRGE